jgi:hypothetical protein
MGIVRSFDRRQEPRWPANLQVMVWGVDTQGERFLQEAHAREVSLSGALLAGLDADLRSGDVIGVLYGKKKARYRVVWSATTVGERRCRQRSTACRRMSVRGANC